MNNVLLVIDGSPSTEQLLDFAIQTTQPTYDNIVILVYQDLIKNRMLKAFNGEEPQPISYNYFELLERVLYVQNLLGQNQIERIVEKCKRHKVKVKLCFNMNCIATELRHETEFGDLLILSQDILNQLQTNELQPERDFYCPVLILPNDIDQIENIALVYDGTAASVSAIKHFGYLLGKSYHSKCFYLITIADGKDLSEQEIKLMEYLRLHLYSVGLYRIETPDEYLFFDFLKNTSNLLFVAGNNSLLYKNKAEFDTPNKHYSYFVC